MCIATRICEMAMINLRIFTAVLMATAVVMLLPMIATAETDQYDFDISSQDVGDALEAFTEQTHYSMLYSIETIGSVHTQPVTGRYSPEAALNIMLENTGLIYGKKWDCVIL